MKNISELTQYLGAYDGRPITLMEVCGSHTAAIAKNGIKSILSDKIKLISGPGCPVCVTPSAYVDRLIELSLEPNTTVTTFGDLIRVPGSKESLQQAKGRGASVQMVYSPMDTLKLAQENPGINFVFAAVGFETTTPIYTILLDQVIKRGLNNVRILTALKTMPEVISTLLDEGCQIDGFIAPGHVCSITGSDEFVPLAEKYGIPFAVSGFEGEELLIAIYGLVKMIEEGRNQVSNYYTSVVTSGPNEKARANVEKYFMKADVAWRGMGIIPNSGLVLKPEYEKYDAKSAGLNDDNKINKACKCGEILKGRATPNDCPLFGKVCKPESPQGACMVSFEGSCHYAYIYG